MAPDMDKVAVQSDQLRQGLIQEPDGPVAAASRQTLDAGTSTESRQTLICGGSVIGARSTRSFLTGPLPLTPLRPQLTVVHGRAVVNFNNQNTVLLKLHINEQEFVLLHDNRMFCFRNDLRSIGVRGVKSDLDVEPAGTPQCDELAQALLLRFQTSPKYRALNSLYFMFRLMDNLLLLTIVVLTVLQHKLSVPNFQQSSVYSAIGVELFYDVLLYTSRFWFLDRLSVYVGFGLYVMYFVLCWAIGAPLYVWLVLLIRMGAYVIENGLDIAIDVEMHNDLLLVCDSWPTDEDSLQYHDVRRSLLDFPHWPLPEFYRGSGSAWLPHSAFAAETYSRRFVPLIKFRWLYVVPVLLTLPFVVMLVILTSVPLLLMVCIDRLLRVRSSTLWQEMTHF